MQVLTHRVMERGQATRTFMLNAASTDGEVREGCSPGMNVRSRRGGSTTSDEPPPTLSSRNQIKQYKLEELHDGRFAPAPNLIERTVS